VNSPRKCGQKRVFWTPRRENGSQTTWQNSILAELHTQDKRSGRKVRSDSQPHGRFLVFPIWTPKRPKITRFKRMFFAVFRRFSAVTPLESYK